MNGRRFRTVNLIYDCNRHALGVRAGFSLLAERVTEFLDKMASRYTQRYKPSPS